jgi:hypothetical protein
MRTLSGCSCLASTMCTLKCRRCHGRASASNCSTVPIFSGECHPKWRVLRSPLSPHSETPPHRGQCGDEDPGRDKW